MKKYINIILLLGVLLTALSCVGTEGLDEIPNGEICMSPVLSDMTKTRAGGATNPYPNGSSFGVFAFYSETEAGQPWYGTPQKYFENHEFRSDAGVCSGVDPVYWPFSGSLIFAGYSPYDAGVSAEYDVSSTTLSITGYDVDGTRNLMYFLPELSEGKHVGYGKTTSTLPIVFHHAMSCLLFNFYKGAGNKTVTLKQVKLSSVYTKANFTVSASNPSASLWSDLSEQKELVIWEKGQSLSAVPLEIEAYVIPGEAEDIVITYHIEGDIDDKVKTIGPDEVKTWAINAKNTYNITINSMGELLLTPTVVNNAVTHVKDANGILIGSELTVNLGNLTSEERARITNLQIVVSSGSTVYKRYSLNKVPDNNTVTFMRGNSTNPDENKLYLPQGGGKYTVTVTYHDGLDNRSVAVNNITSPEPEFKFNVKVGTQPRKLTIRSAVIGISDEVLSEVKAQTYIRVGNVDFKSGTLESASQCITNETRDFDSGIHSMTQTGVVFDQVTKWAEENKSQFIVPSKYSIGSIVTHAANLQNGKKYVIRLRNSTSGWSCEGEGALKHRTVPSDNIGSGYVFIYERDDSRKISSLDQQYGSSSAGAWMSNYDWKYLQGNDEFSFSSTPTYFTCANKWGGETGTDIDIYRETGSGMLNYKNGYLWGNEGTNYYKWYIYAVNEVQ